MRRSQSHAKFAELGALQYGLFAVAKFTSLQGEETPRANPS
jgi:hypothetical protein